MTTGKDAYKSVLADLRAQRDKIDNTIKILEQMAGISGLPTEGVAIAERDPDSALANDDGAFLGMSIADAAIKLLGIKKRKMGNREIVDALVAGGLVMNSADPINTVGSVLTRRFNQVGDVVRVARGTWGLKEWYPNRTFKPTAKSAATADDSKEDRPNPVVVVDDTPDDEDVNHGL